MTAARTIPLVHRTIASSAAEEIRKLIFAGELKDGQPIRQDFLAARLGISRTPIREALVQLETEGLVRSEPHKGAVVAALSLADVEETFELRELLEPELLKASVPRLTEADFQTLAVILKEYSSELRTRNVGRWGELNTALHATLYSRAEKPHTQAIVTRLLNASDRYTRLQLLMMKGLKRAETEHAEIVAHCRAGRTARAAVELKRHIRHVRNELVLFIKRRQRSDLNDNPHLARR